jgi:hypothetical protein
MVATQRPRIRGAARGAAAVRRNGLELSNASKPGQRTVPTPGDTTAKLHAHTAFAFPSRPDAEFSQSSEAVSQEGPAS